MVQCPKRTISGFRQIIQEIWDCIRPQTCGILLNSISNRMHEALHAKGDVTKVSNNCSNLIIANVTCEILKSGASKKSSLQTQVWILVNSLSLSLALMIYGHRQPEADRKGVQRTQYRDLPPPTHRFGQYLRTIIMPSNNWYFSKYAYCTNNGNYSETLFAQKFCGRSSLISIIPEG